MGSKKNRSTGTTAQSLGSLQRQNPQQQWGDVFSNAQDFFGFLGDSVAAPFEEFIGRGEETMANNPMAPIFELLGLRANDQMEKEFPGSTTPEPTQPTPEPTQPTQPAEPQLSAYEARIQELMQKRGWTREEAVANQQNALGLQTDYNNDGAVTNDEWAKYKQTPQGAAYVAQHSPQQPQVPNQAPGQAPNFQINPQIGNLSPQQLAQIQQFQRYRV